MSELYGLADKMLKELQRLEDSGVPSLTLSSYKEQILNYLHENIANA